MLPFRRASLKRQPQSPDVEFINCSHWPLGFCGGGGLGRFSLRTKRGVSGGFSAGGDTGGSDSAAAGGGGGGDGVRTISFGRDASVGFCSGAGGGGWAGSAGVAIGAGGGADDAEGSGMVN